MTGYNMEGNIGLFFSFFTASIFCENMPIVKNFKLAQFKYRNLQDKQFFLSCNSLNTTECPLYKKIKYWKLDIQRRGFLEVYPPITRHDWESYGLKLLYGLCFCMAMCWIHVVRGSISVLVRGNFLWQEWL
jgi:hypothetical protein